MEISRLKSLQTPSGLVLIAANLVPMLGVLFLGWEVFPILFLFWCENVVVGLFNVLRMAMCSGGDRMTHWAKLFMIPFFCVHYGIFTAVHGTFLFGFFAAVHLGHDIGNAIDLLLKDYLFWALVALFLSHAVSFVVNYIGKQEYRRVTLEQLMALPYGRIVVLHVTILFGAFLFAFTGLPSVCLTLLVVLKIIVDLKAHQKEHHKLATQTFHRRKEGPPYPFDHPTE